MLHKYNFYALLFVIFMSPIMSVFSALAIVPLMIPAAIGSVLLMVKNKNYNIYYNSTAKIICCLLLLLAATSYFWSINDIGTIKLFVRVAAIYLLGMPILTFIRTLSDDERNTIVQYVVIATAFAFILFAIELITIGILNSTVRLDVLKKENYEYYPHELNRGASFLAITLPFIRFMIEKTLNKFMLWVVSLILLSLLESFAAISAFIIATIVFLIYKSLPKHALKIMIIGFLAAAIILPIATYKMNYDIIGNNFENNIPRSALHRLYIWNFAMNKADDNIIKGHGFGSSRYIEIAESDWPHADLHPLPVHPHNVLVQSLLETGIIGYSLYLALICVLFVAISKLSDKKLHGYAAASLSAYVTIHLTAYNAWQSWWVVSAIIIASLTLIANQAHKKI